MRQSQEAWPDDPAASNPKGCIRSEGDQTDSDVVGELSAKYTASEGCSGVYNFCFGNVFAVEACVHGDYAGLIISTIFGDI